MKRLRQENDLLFRQDREKRVLPQDRRRVQVRDLSVSLLVLEMFTKQNQVLVFVNDTLKNVIIYQRTLSQERRIRKITESQRLRVLSGITQREDQRGLFEKFLARIWRR